MEVEGVHRTTSLGQNGFDNLKELDLLDVLDRPIQCTIPSENAQP